MLDVLLVDDDADVRLLLGLQLRAAGHQVRSTATVEEALLASVERRPDLLLLDVDLGCGRTGGELVALLDRGVGRPPSVCLLSGAPADTLVPLAARLGVGYLAKPVARPALRAVLDRAGLAHR